MSALRSLAKNANDAQPGWLKFHDFVDSAIVPTVAEFLVAVKPVKVLALLDEIDRLRAQLADARQKAKECTEIVLAFSMNPDDASIAFRVGVATRRLEDALAEPKAAS